MNFFHEILFPSVNFATSIEMFLNFRLKIGATCAMRLQPQMCSQVGQGGDGSEALRGVRRWSDCMSHATGVPDRSEDQRLVVGLPRHSLQLPNSLHDHWHLLLLQELTGTPRHFIFQGYITDTCSCLGYHTKVPHTKVKTAPLKPPKIHSQKRPSHK